MKQIDTLFNRMDAWRHFPNYQLERRADIFFALYLPEVLEAKLRFAVGSELAPEFPVRIGVKSAMWPSRTAKDALPGIRSSILLSTTGRRWRMPCGIRRFQTFRSSTRVSICPIADMIYDRRQEEFRMARRPIGEHDA